MKKTGIAFAAAMMLIAVQTASAEQWSIELCGAGETTLDAEEFAAMKQDTQLYRAIEVEEKGETVEYRGMPLWYVIAMVDDGIEAPPYQLNEEAWQKGYEVTMSAADGYSATFNTADYEKGALYLADSRAGTAISPRIVGEVSTRLQMKNLTQIEVFSPAAKAAEEQVQQEATQQAQRAQLAQQTQQAQQETTQQAPDYSLDLTVGGQTRSFSIAELEQMPFYIEGPGGYITSAGSTYTHVYGGVELADLLGQYVKLQPEMEVTFVAMDGYRKSYTGKKILETGEGSWILAFKRDGEYLPQDPGYIRTVKVGPDTPTVEGSSSVKMVEEIRIFSGS